MSEQHVSDEYRLLNGFLYRHYFRYWEKGVSCKVPIRLELYPTPHCNTKCSYCYVREFGRSTFYELEAAQPEVLLPNTRKVFRWLEENDWVPHEVEIFSGDLFSNQALWPSYLDVVLDWIAGLDRKPSQVMIPTNGTFALYPEQIEAVAKYIERFRSAGTPLVLSISIDGKVVDNYSRPFRDPKLRYDESFYQRLLAFAVKHGYGFHPMLSAQNVHDAEESMHWFLQSLRSVGLTNREALERLFLLEVRNADWCDDALRALERFICRFGRFIFEEVFNEDVQEFYRSFVRKRGMYLFNSGFGHVPRGIGCSMQNGVSIRADLKFIVCHRLGYKGYEGGRLKIGANLVSSIDPINPLFYMACKTFDRRANYVCDACPIRSICGHFCLGANLEATGDAFCPVPTVCRMELVKHRALVGLYHELGVLPAVIDDFSRAPWVNRKMVPAYEYLLDSYLKKVK